jgi:gamma-glutamyltranspeptidase/glutathione hydrolase
MSLVDRQGNAVAMTTTIENGFGSLQMVGGFLLNNQLTDFSFVPTDASGPVANRVEPGKRPRSSMAPTLVFNATSGELPLGSWRQRHHSTRPALPGLVEDGWTSSRH